MGRERRRHKLLEPWAWLVVGVLVVSAIVLAVRQQFFASGASVLAAGAWGFYGRPREATRHDTTSVAAQTAFATLGVTWTTALLGGLVYDLSLPTPTGRERWIPIVLQVALNVGGLIAVFRSAQTRTETRAALREVSELRIAVLTAPLIEAADRAHRATIIADLAAGIESMLRLAVGLTLLPREVDRASFWILNAQDPAPSQWFIFAATTAPNAGHQFSQPSVTTHTLKAGMIANLAVDQPWPADIPGRRAGDVLLVGHDLASHPWYRTYEGELDADGIAIVLLRHRGEPAGALCFTWEHEIPTTGKQTDEMIDVLGRWGYAFGVVLDRLLSYREKRGQP